MKRFLIHLFIWLAVAFVLAIMLDAMISTGLRKTGIRKYAVWNDIYHGNINADVLVIGSSRALYGYSTFILDSLLNCNSYNLGIDGHKFNLQLPRYQAYRRHNPKPSIILLNTDFLSTLDSLPVNLYEREQFFPFMNDFVLINEVAEIMEFTWLDRFVPLARYFGHEIDVENGLDSFFGRTHFPNGGLHKGYRGNNYEWNRASLDSDTLVNLAVDRGMVKQLDGFLNEAMNEGIRVFFIKSPVYLPLMDHFNGIPQTDSVFNSLADRYNVPILDYYYTPIGIDSTFFYNPSHLNKRGSEVFTTELCKDLVSYLGQ